MALEEEQEGNPIATKPIPSPSPKSKLLGSGVTDSSSRHQQDDVSPAKKASSAREQMVSIARKYSSQSLQNSDPGVWGVLTAISENARKRSQGMNILLSNDEHCIGRLVTDARFRIESSAVSSKHCQIYRERIGSGEHDTCVFLKDSSTNGTYLNWEKLKKNVSGAKVQHGDIVSFAAAPESDHAFAFVYREVPESISPINDAASKRKAEEIVGENKRLKGIGIGAPEGPISLDDVRSLQRSNMELRKQLDAHVHTIETLRNENREAVARHENELKETKESVSQSYLNGIKELNQQLEVKHKELVHITAVSAERQQAIVDLNERLSASMQSRTDADEIINSQKAIISEHERQLSEERNQRMEEREKALADKKAALQRAHLEAQEELRRQSENASRQERELKEVFTKLQDSDKESRQLVETLRFKLEETRENVVRADQKVRQLEAQVQEEQKVSMKYKKKLESLENELKRLRKELESEKVAREEAWAKVSALELEMAAAVRDLSLEKQKFQGARERIILRETQLRQFYSTTEEITELFTKQREQLKAMQRALEDEDNYANIPFETEENPANGNYIETLLRAKEKVTPRSHNDTRHSSATSTPRVDRTQMESTSNDDSVTEKHECDPRNQEEHHTQDLECTSADPAGNGAFGSDIDGVGTVPELEGDPAETERVLCTESPNDANVSKNIDLNRSMPFTGDTMQLDEDMQVHETEDLPKDTEENDHNPQMNNSRDAEAVMEDTDATGTMKTADLLTSEVAGSWAMDTAPSVHGENDSPRSEDRDEAGSNDDEAAGAHLCSSDGQAAGSQAASATTRLSQERKALNAMIEIVAPGFNEQFGGSASSRGKEEGEVSNTDSDTQNASDNEENDNGVDVVVKTVSDEDTQEGSGVDDSDNDDAMDDDDERQEDSLG